MEEKIIKILKKHYGKEVAYYTYRTPCYIAKEIIEAINDSRPIDDTF